MNINCDAQCRHVVRLKLISIDQESRRDVQLRNLSVLSLRSKENTFVNVNPKIQSNNILLLDQKQSEWEKMNIAEKQAMNEEVLGVRGGLHTKRFSR